MAAASAHPLCGGHGRRHILQTAKVPQGMAASAGAAGGIILKASGDGQVGTWCCFCDLCH